MRHCDLFCGIGGFRLGVQQACEEMGESYECNFSSDIAKVSREVYKDNFGEYPSGDITQISEHDIPDHDILSGGFPCQAFSCAGKRLGFDDPRGNLIYHILRIAQEKKPRVLFLENVVGILHHNGGETFKEILKAIADVGYWVKVQTLNSLFYGVPQHRRRVFFICFREKDDWKRFAWPSPMSREFGHVGDILAPETVTYNCYISKSAAKKALINFRECHIIDETSFSGTLSVQGNTCGFMFDESVTVDELQAHGRPVCQIRTFTGREQARLQGFPDSFILPKSKSPKAVSHCFGNSVTVTIIKAVAKNIIHALKGDELSYYDPAEQRAPFIVRPLKSETEARRQYWIKKLGLKDEKLSIDREFEYPLLRMKFY